MPDWMDRNAIIDEVVVDLIAAGSPDYAFLNGLTSESIQYSEGDPLDIQVVKEDVEIWVSPGGGASNRAASTKFNTTFVVRILVLRKGWEEVDDKKAVVDLSEDIEHYYKTNPDIGSAPRLARFMGQEGDMTMTDRTVFVQTSSSAGMVYFRLIEMMVHKYETS